MDAGHPTSVTCAAMAAECRRGSQRSSLCALGSQLGSGTEFENVRHLILYDFGIHWLDMAVYGG